MGTFNKTFNKSHFHYLRKYLWEGMMAYGCNFFRTLGNPGRIRFPIWPSGFRGVNLCLPDAIALQGRRSIRPLCPELCACNSTVSIDQKITVPVLLRTECPYDCFLSPAFP